MNKLFRFNQKPVPQRFGGNYFIPVGYLDSLFETKEPLKQFLEIPEVNTILNIRARAMASWQLNMISKTTGAEVSNNQSLVRILRTPNWFQSFTEFWRQTSIYRDVYGNEFLYFLTPEGMGNTYKGLFTLDPAKVTIKYASTELPFMNQDGGNIEYYYSYKGKNILLDKADIIHLNDNRIKTDGDNFLTGTSKIESLMPAINNLREAYKKRNIILRMPVGVMSNNQMDAIGTALPMDEKEKEKAQHALENHGALPILTNLNIAYSKMDISARAMGLFEETIEDTGRICDAFGVPYKLLSSAKAGTLNNSGGDIMEAKKQMYEETIIPDAREKLNAINSFIQPQARAWDIEMDFGHLPVFAEDTKLKAETLNLLINALDRLLEKGIITIEQYKSEIEKFGI